VTSPLTAQIPLNPGVTARAIGRQSGDLGEKWPLNFAYETFIFIIHSLYYIP
jgi:hypothetical protein